MEIKLLIKDRAGNITAYDNPSVEFLASCYELQQACNEKENNK